MTISFLFRFICCAALRSQRKVIGVARTDLETAATIQAVPGVDEPPGFHARKVDDVLLGADDDTISAVIAALGVETHP